jgi:hypothetical protein
MHHCDGSLAARRKKKWFIIPFPDAFLAKKP